MTDTYPAWTDERVEAPTSLDFFPTPPWATRALLNELGDVHAKTVLEPAAGEGHMAEVLRESFGKVIASDVHDYGKGYLVGSYSGCGLDVLPKQYVDWVITNPPFNKATEFFERAIDEASEGVALLVRNSWLEGRERHDRIFSVRKPRAVLQFAEHVPMVRGRWDPQASSATSYIWVVWVKAERGLAEIRWIEPGAKEKFSRKTDVVRFTA